MGFEYSTMNYHRSAISTYHNYDEYNSAVKHPEFSALITGVFNANPPVLGDAK